MNKYLKGSINLIIKSASLFLGFALAINVLFLVFFFLPDLMTRVDRHLILNTEWWASIVPGLLPLFFILTTISVMVLIVCKTFMFAQLLDIEKVIREIKGKKGEVNE